MRRVKAEFGTRMPCVRLPCGVALTVASVQSSRATAIGENAPGRNCAASRFSGDGKSSPSPSNWSTDASSTCSALKRGRLLT